MQFMTEKHGLSPEPFQHALLFREAVSRSDQEKLVESLRAVAQAAPFVQHVTPGGKPMSVKMTSAGDYGWVSDRRGYRYEPAQKNGDPWPAIPEGLLELWKSYANSDRMPDCCLINYYAESSRMGLHQDRDEADFSHPVLSLSLGDEAQFRIGGADRRDPTRSVWLRSGDIVLLAGKSRLAFHGVDKLRFGSSTLLKNGGRINVTLRVVT